MQAVIQHMREIMTRTLLVIDDDPDDFDFLRFGCEAIGVGDFIFYDNTEEAKAFMLVLEDNQLPAIIVTDCNMPKGSGEDFIKYLKAAERFAAIKTVVMSGSFTAMEIKNFEDLGVDKVFIKPNQMSEYERICSELKKLIES